MDSVSANNPIIYKDKIQEIINGFNAQIDRRTTGQTKIPSISKYQRIQQIDSISKIASIRNNIISLSQPTNGTCRTVRKNPSGYSNASASQNDNITATTINSIINDFNLLAAQCNCHSFVQEPSSGICNKCNHTGCTCQSTCCNSYRCNSHSYSCGSDACCNSYGCGATSSCCNNDCTYRAGCSCDGDGECEVDNKTCPCNIEDAGCRCQGYSGYANNCCDTDCGHGCSGTSMCCDNVTCSHTYTSYLGCTAQCTCNNHTCACNAACSCNKVCTCNWV